MSANEVLLPPWVIPQGESSTLVDDSTSVFRAAYAPGNAQRVAYVDPRLQVKQTFQGLRSFERGAMLAAMKRAGGKFCTVRAIVGYKLRGSFPLTEMFSNNDFSAGINGWSSDAQYSLTALDHGIRATRIKVTAASAAVFQNATQVAGVPYSFRAFINAGKGGAALSVQDLNVSASSALSSQGMLALAYTSMASVGGTAITDSASSGTIAGNFFDLKWISFARCAQVDNGVNLLLNSDTPGTGTGWSLNMATAATASAGGPDGALDAWKLTETATTGAHYALQSVTVAAAAADFSYSVLVNQAASPRGFCWVQIIETLGSTLATAYLNLSTGAVTNVSGGTNISVIGTPIAVNYGGGWWRVILTVRKTNAATTIQLVTGTAQAAGTQSFAGSTSAFLVLWRASLAPSSVPVAPIQTTSAAITGTNQTGNSINVKGLPASTADLLLEDDLFEINGELKGAISPLSSDAAGLGSLFFAPSLCRSPADGDGVIINKPMGKFILAADSNWENDYGVYANADITLEAINE